MTREEGNKNFNLKIGITHGDFNGISYELVLKTLNDNTVCESLTPVFFGCSRLVSYFRNYFGIPNFSFAPIRQNEIIHKKPNLYNIFSEEVKVVMGEETEDAANLCTLSMDKAHNAISNKLIDALVCCPAKQSMIKERSQKHIGNGSYFINKLKPSRCIQLLCNDHIKVTSATTRLNAEELKRILTVDFLFEKIKLLNQVLINDFMIESPRIAILATNPVDDSGKFVGGEIEKVIEKANEEALKNRIQSFGPYLPAVFFHNCEYTKFDVIMSIIDHQADTIFALLNGKDGIIYTAGLPFVVTEPYHPMGQGDIELETFRNALYMADEITKNRRMNYRLRRNAMPRIKDNSDNNSNKDS